MNAIEVRDLSFAYDRQKPVLDHFDLSLGAGNKLALLGPSGAGKSTLLSLLTGLLEGQGVVRIAGIEVTRSNRRSVREQIGLVFQNPDEQLFHPRVIDDVSFGLINQGIQPDEARARAIETLEALEISGCEERMCHELSFGEKRRVALAGVLAMQPSIIALDEPFANLSPALSAKLASIIRGLDASVLLVTQDLVPAMACCDELALLEGGKLQAHGPALEIARDSALLERCGLGPDLHRRTLARIDFDSSSPPEDR